MGKTILTHHQQCLLEHLSSNQTITSQFYLTGGTALAEFYYQHRLSEDLDFFSVDEFDSLLLQKQITSISEALNIKELQYQQLRGQEIYLFHIQKERIKVDFAYFPFEHIGIFKKMGQLRIASTEDIAVNKIQAIVSRKRGRDFFDLYTILTREKWPLEKLLKGYRLKFEVSLHPQEFAKHLSGILDASDQPRFLGEVDWKRVEQFFLNLAKEI